MTYTIGIRGHDVARSREVTFQGSLTQAKALATREFGGGFSHHRIVILDEAGNLIASRVISQRKWTAA